MSRMSPCHEKLTDGVGKCSVPMWMNGCPAGFCDSDAFGKQEPGQRRSGQYGAGWLPEDQVMWGSRWRPSGVWKPSYAPGLACYQHGGPKGGSDE